MKLVVIGLSITSSWGNGHATTWRALLSQFAGRGHDVLFLERDVPWYAQHRDLTHCPWAEIILYNSQAELRERHQAAVRNADAVIVGSYVQDGIDTGNFVVETAQGITAFYDIDTPVTLEAIEAGSCDYLSPALIRSYDLYFSFTGGPILNHLETRWGSPCALPLYCAVDPSAYFPAPVDQPRWDLGYLGTYSGDRQPPLEQLLLNPALRSPGLRFVVAGSQYPDSIAWPENVERIDHLAPPDHRDFYNNQKFTLNVTRSAMRKTGWAPSVRLFEAGACGIPVISDDWPGLSELFLPGREILIARTTEDVCRIMAELSPAEAREIGAAARQRVLHYHTSAVRAAELEKALAHPRPVHPRKVSAATPLAVP